MIARIVPRAKANVPLEQSAKAETNALLMLMHASAAVLVQAFAL